ncbi:hypothetical protein A2419_02595 [Candidatus Adlerbacteria bacterium RIFOXYC1_FULL_48_26]|uniref:Uncharacterized protein n=1 Tax=Candidatus Adlerbacteria bacterium RIFOXYC1_FULL_48_26 TaxID=1797247 RepID=A0A1F4Y4M2_9BACT|nr:MAG: hypothetical protein A2419_02595 [Candidatus Adlerbacteria bacterium RIFOXYC1_FULL_48_26]
MENFSEHIVKEIAERGATPKPRWHFLLKRSVFWTLAGLAIVTGGIAVSVAWYVFSDNDGLRTLGQPALQDTLRDFAQSIPYIWLFVLGLFTASAYLGFRRTRKGYRYATVVVVGAAIILSLVFGLILDRLDFGQTVHKYLLSNTTVYDKLIHSSEDEGDYEGNY